MKSVLFSVSTFVVFLSVSLLSTGKAFADPLKIGITLHPYYSFVANVVGDRAEIIPLIDAGNNPHNYTPQANDIRRVLSMDVLVVNGIGHDEWAFEIIQAAGRKEQLPLIYANDGVPLIPVAADEGEAKVVNAHTFVSTTVAIQQIYTIARELGKLDSDNATYFRNNARAYALKIRRLKAEYMTQLSELDTSTLRCATMHGAYGYLMQEFGLQVVAVIEPRHGVEPTARQLADTIDKIKSANVNVLFAEKYFASNLSETIREATGVSMYSFSHMSDGEYSAGLFETETRANLETLVEAMRSVAAAK
ncbi:MAG: ABC transporter substrate-binding protein [SAR86 cluster bacterium]|uniref:High-affinity zinc uptake system protein ZnuA n=1 Tax=SAR86 cluster bacterium TaxID=2030880 RepID=A0A2A5BAY6_9GAMM|nr:MAG: ABC transporter substrate-binding protein [SAR86 cluster bacterium]